MCGRFRASIRAAVRSAEQVSTNRDAGDGGPAVPDNPEWQLDSVYPGLDSREFRTDVENLQAAISEARDIFADRNAARSTPATWLKDSLDLINRLTDLFVNLEAYCYTQYSVDTGNEAVVAALNKIMELTVPMTELQVDFRNTLAEVDADPEDLVGADEDLRGYRFFLEEELFFQTRQLSVAEEQLAADLNRSGGDAWGRLQESVSSTLSSQWDSGNNESKTVVELRALAMHPERPVRQRAYELELAAWKTVEIPLAAALNGVKGFTHTLNSRRGWESTLERSIRQSRISRATLDSLIGTMESNLPVFRRYLRAKANLLGLDRISFYDLFAPVGKTSRRYSFAEAKEFIIQQFSGFTPELGSFARHAFDSGWIDAKPRPGKVGGAYCVDFPVAGESRILANFDGTYDGVSTLAHELGHAYHSHLLRGLPSVQRDYPMTLAETASIFSETLVFNKTLEESSKSDKLAILEFFLQGATQVIVDILSRFKFESWVMDRRAETELSPREFSELMLRAQEETYGDAMSEADRHQYMWAVKGHYYRPELAFYNFPYAFGQLFGMGLFSQYRADPSSFPEQYQEILLATGSESAVTVTANAGFNIEQPDFWQQAIDTIGGYIAQFEELAAAAEK